MPAANEDFGRAVTEALQWMGLTAVTAGRELGIKPETMNAMSSGIVPMRSIVIKFASELGRRTQARAGSLSWWSDVDAWLAVAGYPPRRDFAPQGVGSRESGRDVRISTEAAPAAAAGARQPPGLPLQQRRARSDDPKLQEPACDHYRPVYERMYWGDTHFHIFWLVDRSQKRTHQFRFPAEVDYQRRADRLKHDLSTLTKVTFERRYARYRLDAEP